MRLLGLEAPSFRLDAKYYQGEFVQARECVRASGFESLPLSEIAEVRLPNRIASVTVPHSSAGAPYLRAHDVFDVRPESDRYLARARTRNYSAYLLSEGTILTPSSGRNLGPLAYVGGSLAGFAMTDILRIAPRDRAAGFYLLSYLLTQTGQAFIRRGRTGTSVDHLSEADVRAIPVVWPDGIIRNEIAGQMESAERLLDEARGELQSLENLLLRDSALDASQLAENAAGSAEISTVTAGGLAGRLDAAFYSRSVQACMADLRKCGAETLSNVADLRLLGRYKRYYVEEGHGRPILSGRQLLQLRPVNLRFISDRSFAEPESFVLHAGWSVFTCDGRAEEGLASAGYIHDAWDGWLASNHVMRAVAKTGMHAGYLYLALRSPFVQIQLKSHATGSVVDALEPATVNDILLPMLNEDKRTVLGDAAVAAWSKVARAITIGRRAVGRLEGTLASADQRGKNGGIITT